MAKTDDLLDRVTRVDPREVSDVDLLAILLAGTTSKEDPELVAARLLRDGQQKLDLVLSRAMSNPTLPLKSRARLSAVHELQRRATLREAVQSHVRVTGPREAEAWLRPLLGTDVEHVAVLYLDVSGNVKKAALSTIGSANASIFDTPGILRGALVIPTVRSLIVAHNHPSGRAEFSSDDLRSTRALKDAAKSVGLTLSDHLLFTRSDMTSMAQSHLL
jgi:DNA repair protein RadC